VSGQVVGYVRVSTTDQRTDRQREAIGSGVEEWFEDKVSGKDTNRPALTAMLRHVRKGDTVRVASMDRLARSLPDLRALVDKMTGKGVRVEFVKEGLTFSADKADAMSTLLLNMLGAVAEFERSLIRERQAEGIALAKSRGVYTGRKAALTAEQVRAARELVDAGVPKAKVARDLGVSRQTLYAALTDAYEPAAS
jgi:DNA invertase Pin-like site-specific DNA recombinase